MGSTDKALTIFLVTLISAVSITLITFKALDFYTELKGCQPITTEVNDVQLQDI